MPMPRAFSEQSADAVAYERIITAFIPAWYPACGVITAEGVLTDRVMNLSDNSVEKLPWTNSNDTLPMDRQYDLLRF